MLMQEQGCGIDCDKIAHDIFSLAPFDLDMSVRVGPIARGGQEQGQRGPGSAAPRSYHKRHVVLSVVLRYIDAVQAAGEILWDGESKVGLPAAVVEIVIVKMDGAVMGRQVRPVVLA